MNLLNCGEYIRNLLKIRTKEGSILPLIMNPPQRRLYETIRSQWEQGKPIRILILKARQMGFSTLTAAIIFWMTVTACYVESLVVAHKDDATRNLFLMYKRFYSLLPEPLKPMQRASNANELVFDRPSRMKEGRDGLGSRIRCATAGGSGVGRSYTVKCLHLSEFAFWPGDKRDTFTGLVQSVPDLPGTMIIIESTANGFDEFKNMWDSAERAQREGTDGYTPVFFAWYEMPEYRRKPLPGFRRTQEEQELAETFGLDDEQLAWRRWCIATQCGGDIDLFHQEYPATPDEAFISTGRCVFDKQALVLRREQVRKLSWESGAFRIKKNIAEKIESFHWVPDPKGPIRIRRHPEAGVPYVFGGDTAGTGSDKFAGHMLDNRTGEQVAVLHHQFGERMFAEQAYCLGKYYNDALVGIETNYSTFPQLCLEDLGYKHFYVRERLDNYTGRIMDAYGFQTTTRSRPLIIDGLKDVAREALETITDYDTLGEMLTFVYDENWKPQAENGEHDDLVISLAIAHQIRPQQRYNAEGPAEKTVQWSASQWEDYDRASSGEKAILISKWGKPDRRKR